MAETDAAKHKLMAILDSLYHEGDGGVVLYFTDDECEIIADHLLKHGIGLDAENVFHNVMILPCNIGDTIYEAFFTTDGTGSHICGYTCSGIHIAEKVTRWRSEKPVRYFVLKTAEGHSIRIRMDELGKTLFLTRAEAEAALRKGRKDYAE